MRYPTHFSLAVLSFVVCFPFRTDGTKDCLPRLYEGQASVSCVCNSTYCDVVKTLKTGKPGSYVVYTSTLDGLRLKKNSSSMMPMSEYVDTESWLPFFKPTLLRINRSETYQEVYGFGAAFTDSAGINIGSLSKKAGRKLMESYFGKDGLEFNIGRVPIGGTDYSTHLYAYNMWPEDDVNLSNFSLSTEDFKYKIPYIKQARKIATSELYLTAVVWSPPKWMKTNDNYYGVSLLYDKYYQTYADYHIRFLEEYEKYNISFWSISTGNEPMAGLTDAKLNTLGWIPSELGLWIEKYFGPTVRQSKYKDIKILAVDDFRIHFLWWIVLTLEKSPKALDYIDGIATHSYFDRSFSSGIIQDLSHMFYPNKFLISTETAVGSMSPTNQIQPGSWKRAEIYIEKLIEYFNHWMTGVLNWNLATDLKTGGPTWRDFAVESLIMTDSENDEFVKLPIFYAFGHFSKFVPRGSVRVKSEVVQGNVNCVAFRRPDMGITVIFNNPSDDNRTLTILEEGKGFMKIDVPKKSIQTVVYW